MKRQMSILYAMTLRQIDFNLLLAYSIFWIPPRERRLINENNEVQDWRQHNGLGSNLRIITRSKSINRVLIRKPSNLLDFFKAVTERKCLITIKGFFYLAPSELWAFLEKTMEIRFSWQTYRPTPFWRTLLKKRLGVPLEVIVNLLFFYCCTKITQSNTLNGNKALRGQPDGHVHSAVRQ